MWLIPYPSVVIVWSIMIIFALYHCLDEMATCLVDNSHSRWDPIDCRPSAVISSHDWHLWTSMMTSSNGNILRPPVKSPHKGQWRGALMFSLICVQINAWENNREAGDLRRYHAHYDVIVMSRQNNCHVTIVCTRLLTAVYRLFFYPSGILTFMALHSFFFIRS